MIFAGGQSTGKGRAEAAERFNTCDVAFCQVLLLSTKLGGRGLHLTGATRFVHSFKSGVTCSFADYDLFDRIIHLEPVWNRGKKHSPHSQELLLRQFVF